MEEDYRGRVTEEQDEDVVVRYALPGNDFLEQLYGKSQFIRGKSPSVDDHVVTEVRIYRSAAPPPDPGESGGYVHHHREKAAHRIPL